jgi:hypothetical protein
MILAVTVVVAAGCTGTDAAGAGGPWTAAEALQPSDLAATLKGSGARPAILYIGFRALYLPGHIPGATFVGPPSQPAGFAALKDWASTHAKDETVVLYCGCCPFSHCPNMVPGYTMLRQLGYTKIRVLILPTNFEVDWVDMGYPIERS